MLERINKVTNVGRAQFIELILYIQAKKPIELVTFDL